MESTTSGASSAKEFQPETGNPQSNVDGGLQPNSANLQPITNSKSSNAFNQPGINPQAFPKTNSLSVLSSGERVLPDQSAATTANSSSNFLTLFIFASIAAVLVILILAKWAIAGDKTEKNKAKSFEVATQLPEKSKPKTKKRSKPKKKSSKKKK